MSVTTTDHFNRSCREGSLAVFFPALNKGPQSGSGFILGPTSDLAVQALLGHVVTWKTSIYNIVL